ncbi:MAG: hypothetical protein SFW35_12930 [Chitinophagales bacterium]|nr:hypothetical protein [Chitinophagales bacterium]
MGAGLVVSNIFLLTTKLRVTITEEQIHLKFGIFQDTISMEQIESFEVNKLSWWTYGIGYRLSPFTKTTAYIMEGSTQVKLHLTKGSVVVFSTKNSTACIHALQQLGLSMGMSFASAKGKST